MSASELLAACNQSVPANLKWRDLVFSVPGPKEVLRGVSGHLQPGELACILGPSGAGKSTLLNVLAGRQRTSGNGFRLTGAIELGGQVLNPKQIRRQVAYVMQDDVLCSTQTVRESLMFSAALKLPDVPAEQREARVQALLTSLGLDACADTMVGSALVRGVSGGERKRTSVGVELIANSKYVLLDEPTSGLDSFAARQLVDLLKELAQNGRTVCCTIHQPSSDVFMMFDNVMCLRTGGTMLYQGPNSQVFKFLEGEGVACPQGYSVADWLLTKAQEPRTPSALSEASAETSIEDEATYEPEQMVRASFFEQLKHLVRREANNVRRDKKALGARFGMTIGQALLYCCLFPGVSKSGEELTQMAHDAGPLAAQRVISERLGSEFGAITGLGIASMFGAAQPLLLSFPLERPVFLREYSSNMYSVPAYFLSKTIVEVVVAILQVSALVLITYWVLGFKAFFAMVFALWLLAISAGSLALWIGCLVTSATSAVQLGPLVTVPQILFSGIFLKSDQLKIPLRWFQYLCVLKYSTNLACIGEFGSLEVKLEIGGQPVTYAGTTFLEGQDIDKDLWWLYVTMLLAIFFIFRFSAMLSLWRKGQFVF